MVERIGMGEHNLSLVRTNIYLVTVHKSCQMVLHIPEKKKERNYLFMQYYFVHLNIYKITGFLG